MQTHSTSPAGPARRLSAPIAGRVKAGALIAGILIGGCSSQVGDLDDLRTSSDACDPRGRAERGTDLRLQMLGMPHVGERVLFAITQADSVEGMAVIHTLPTQDFLLQIDKFLPEGNSTLAFWADSSPVGTFNSLDDPVKPDHQWTRPVCPNGEMTFTHETPFQDVRGATAAGARFVFEVPQLVSGLQLRRRSMWVRVTELDLSDQTTEVQTRGFFLWSPPGEGTPEAARAIMREFRIEGAGGERLGPIDQLSFYNVEFVIDLDNDGRPSGADVVCLYRREQAPDAAEWRFTPNVTGCDTPVDFEFD